MTQKTDILDRLLSGHKLTSMEALAKFSCARLAARINDLINEGHEVKKEMIPVRVRNGKTLVARYYL